jgi:phosphopantothenoylcysteine decarboxylase/phosphopantothenate--cysteine ligase
MNPKPYLIGFAAETEKLRENALKKMEEKNIDAIVTNDVSRDDIGFSSDYNEANLYFRDGTEVSIPKDEKDAVAFRILECVSKRFAL